VPNIIFNKRLNLGFNSIDKKIIKAGIIKTHEAENNFCGVFNKLSPLIIRSTLFGTYNTK